MVLTVDTWQIVSSLPDVQFESDGLYSFITSNGLTSKFYCKNVLCVRSYISSGLLGVVDPLGTAVPVLVSSGGLSLQRPTFPWITPSISSFTAIPGRREEVRLEWCGSWLLSNPVHSFVDWESASFCAPSPCKNHWFDKIVTPLSGCIVCWFVFSVVTMNSGYHIKGRVVVCFLKKVSIFIILSSSICIRSLEEISTN
jgi:hypothetical protein